MIGERCKADAAASRAPATNDESDGSIGDLKASLDKLKIADKEQKELISIVESTRAEVAEER